MQRLRWQSRERKERKRRWRRWQRDMDPLNQEEKKKILPTIAGKKIQEEGLSSMRNGRKSAKGV